MKRTLSLSSGIALALPALLALAATQIPVPAAAQLVAGTVTAAGRAVAGVRVFSSAGATVLTNAQGAFGLPDSSNVLHVERDGYQPITLLVSPAQAGLRIHLQPISLDPLAGAVLVRACAPLPPETGRHSKGEAQRLGPIGSRLQFTIPRHSFSVTSLGGVNLDETILQPRHSHAQLTLWFGVHALPPVPGDDVFLQSAVFAQRAVVLGSSGASSSALGPSRFLGIDSYGSYSNGARWRHLSAGNAGATYGPADAADAQLFDSVIGSLCVTAGP